MSIPTRAQIEIVTKHVVAGIERKLHLQSSNVASRKAIIDFAKAVMAATNGIGVGAYHWPWRIPAQLTGTSLYAGMGCGSGQGPYSWYNHISQSLADYDDRRHRRTTTTPWSYLKSSIPQVIGAILTGFNVAQPTPNVFAASDVPIRMIGQPWFHPAVAISSVSIALGGGAGQPYLSIGAALNSSLFQGAMALAWGNAYLRLTAGVDAGLYRVRWVDLTNYRVYLSNLDGTNFVAAGGAQSGLTGLVYYRTSAYFNETGITPTSQGSVTLGGTYDPGTARQSRLFRFHIEKSGSPNPSGGAHLKGSYWFTSRPYNHGWGGAVTNNLAAADDGGAMQSVYPLGAGAIAPTASAGMTGGSPGVVVDEVNQRMWSCQDNGTNGSLWWWLFKTPEHVHEIATSVGTPNDPMAGIAMTGSRARGVVLGTDGTVYYALAGTNAGLVKITTGLVASQWLAGVSTVTGLAIDKTRNRTTAAGTVSTTAGTGKQQVTVTGGAFTQADVGRLITLSGGSADNGTYRIVTVTGATTITVETPVASTAPNGGTNVTFTGTSNSGGMTIGDRIYLHYNDTTGWAGSGAGFISIRYMDSLAFGTLFVTGDHAVTASTGRTTYEDATVSARGAPPPVAIDPANGNLFWVSSDTAQRINRYDVTTRAVSQKALSTFTAGADASGYVTPATALCVGVNPSSYFREVWVGTDQGMIRFSPDHADLSTLTAQAAYAWTLPTANYRRYYGDGQTTSGVQPTGYMRLTSFNSGTQACGSVWFGRDGKVWIRQGTSNVMNRSTYERENDTFANGQAEISFFNGASSGYPSHCVTSNDEVVQVAAPANNAFFNVAGLPIDFQWIGAAWVPKQVIRGVIPDATSSPGCSTKDLHTTLDDLMFGVKVQFGTGAGTDVQQFAGRMSQKQAQQNDGAWAGGNFTGSNFTSSDVGRILRVESGANQGTYLVTTYVNATTITVQTMARGAFGPTEAGPLNYTLWDLGNAGAGVGAETVTFVAADGLFADNTQDITNINAEVYYAKTEVSEQTEAIKVAYGVPAPPGSPGIAVYFATQTGASTIPGSQSGQALDSGSPVTLPEQVVDYAAGRTNMDGTKGRASLPLPSNNQGVDASACSGAALTVDLGADVEVGAIVVRFRGNMGGVPYHLWTEANNQAGMLANIHKANSAGGAPVTVVATTNRRSTLVGASGLSIPRTTPPTATLSSGDFLAAASVTYSDGATTQGGNTLTSAAGRFTGLTGGVVRLTSGSDLGYYRIISVDGTGGIATVRNLDQSAKAWGATASGLSFVIHANAAREDDILISGTHRTTIEMLTSPTVARVRTYSGSAITGAAWEVLIPSWTLVKRVSHSVVALPPDVASNGTYMDSDGADSFPRGVGYANTDLGFFKAVADFSDLSSAARTGRWWKFSHSGRFAANQGVSGASIIGIEFYDTSGKRLLAGASNMVDTVESRAEFMACHVTRLDWIQALYAASATVPGVNAAATLGGTNGNQVTLAGAAKFLPLRIFQGTTLTAAGGDASIALGGADRPFGPSDVGRIIWIQAGPNAGYWRIVTTPTGTSATLVNMSGVAPTLTADATPRAWSLHEGILAGTTNYDYISLGTLGEFSINAVSNDLTTITLNDTTFLSGSGLAWEIKRRAYPVGWQPYYDTVGADASQVARLIYSHTDAPRQVGDVMQDYKGSLSFYASDVGTALTRTADGTSAAGTGYQTFTSAGSLFTPDDVGRMLVILTGVDAGTYLIRSYVAANQITVQHLRSGGQVTWTGAAGANYKVVGERRFRASRYVTVLRQ